jgi:hypothetical protein
VHDAARPSPLLNWKEAIEENRIGDMQYFELIADQGADLSR